MLKWIALAAAIALGLYLGISLALDEGATHSNGGRADVRDFIQQATKNGHRVELRGNTITAWDCTSSPRHFPPIPPGITLECVDGAKGVVWKRP